MLVTRGLTNFELLDQSGAMYEMYDVPLNAEPNNLYTRFVSGLPNPILTILEGSTRLKWAEKEAHWDYSIAHQVFLSGKNRSPIHTGDVDTAPVRTSAPSTKNFVPPKLFRPSVGSSSVQKKPISLHPENLIKPPTNPIPNLNSPKTLPDSYWSAQWSVGTPFVAFEPKALVGVDSSKRNTGPGMTMVLLRAQKEGSYRSY